MGSLVYAFDTNSLEDGMRCSLCTALGQSDTCTLTLEDIQSVTELILGDSTSCSGKYFTTLEPLSNCLNLETLTLKNDNSDLGNLTTMASLDTIVTLPSLTSLSIIGATSLDFDARFGFKNLIFLKSLILSNCGVSDVTGISVMRNLQSLSLDENGSIGTSSSLDEIALLYDLESFSCKTCSLSSLRFLSNSTNLTNIDVSFNYLKDVSPLFSLLNLNTVTISNNYICDPEFSAKGYFETSYLSELNANSMITDDCSACSTYPFGMVEDSADCVCMERYVLNSSQNGCEKAEGRCSECVHGTCVESGARYLCSCENGWIGDFCNDVLLDVDTHFNGNSALFDYLDATYEVFSMQNVQETTSLYISDESIASADGLELFSSLSVLKFYCPALSDVSSVSQLLNLSDFTINDSLITAIPLIRGPLTTFDCSLSKIEDLSPLFKFSSGMMALSISFGSRTENSFTTDELDWIADQSSTLERFDFYGTSECDLTDTSVGSLGTYLSSGSPMLTTIHFENIGITTLACLSTFPTSITKINIQNTNLSAETSVGSSLSQFPLEMLILVNLGLDNTAVSSISNLGTSLYTVRLDGNPITENTIELSSILNYYCRNCLIDVFDFSTLLNVEYLWLEGNYISSIPDNLPSNLKSFDISNMKVPISTFNVSSFPASLVDLFNISGTTFPASALPTILSSTVPYAKLLMSDCHLTDLSTLTAPLPQSLTYIDLSYNDLNAFNTGLITSIPEDVEFYIDLSYNIMDDSTIVDLLSYFNSLFELESNLVLDPQRYECGETLEANEICAVSETSDGITFSYSAICTDGMARSSQTGSCEVNTNCASISCEYGELVSSDDSSCGCECLVNGYGDSCSFCDIFGTCNGHGMCSDTLECDCFDGFTGDSCEYIAFDDENLNNYICNIVNEDSTACLLTISDLTLITELSIPTNIGVVSLGGIRYMYNLTSLSISGLTSIDDSDVEEISYLNSLTYLCISETDIRSLAPLASISDSLTNLVADSCENLDYLSISSLSSLTTLVIDEVPIIYSSFFSFFPNLQTLSASGCGIVDISFVLDLVDLVNIDLSYNEIYDMTAVYFHPLYPDFNYLNISYNYLCPTAVEYISDSSELVTESDVNLLLSPQMANSCGCDPQPNYIYCVSCAKVDDSWVVQCSYGSSSLDENNTSC
ncbi:hypothetical protein ADUPG1_009297, partial [Aduncisulcus paluster]